jgi:hypothetical protein
MKPFELESKMLTMRGVFYPTGYLFAMFPTREDAEQVDQALQGRSSEHETMLLTPEDVMGKVVSTVGGSDAPLPSAGSEAEMARKYAEFASKGHYALMIHAPTEEDGEQVMDAVRTAPFSIAEKYRKLVIQDME